MSQQASPSSRPTRLSPMRAVLGFGLVSLFADMVYEGARSLYGPALLSLGASAAVVGLVTGAGEAMALVLRLIAGPVADRRGAHWAFTIGGYATTAFCVPLMAISPKLGAVGLAFAIIMLLAERTGKALRSPSKSALLAHAARKVGRGSGFGIHKALDQIGAFAGPLLVTAVIAAAGGVIWPGFGWLIVPGILAMVLLFALRAALPDPTVYDDVEDESAPKPSGVQEDSKRARSGAKQSWWRDMAGADLPREFFSYAFAAALTTGGLATFALLSVHLVRDLNVAPGVIPLWYAGAMLVEAIAALITGKLYDRNGSRVLLVVPIMVALVPILAFTPSLTLAALGVIAWACVAGVQDSTIKALVADLVPSSRLATAYGVFAAIQGSLAILGGLVIGALLDTSLPALVAVVALTQAVALVLLWKTTRRAA